MYSNQNKQLNRIKQLENGSLTLVALTWEEFTQTTTFHGIRYIFTSGNITRK